ncbi:MAG TPA: hypothetical protein VN579_07500 [Bryobacteraceae bacterium]|nr:hypothetical protein [Bryobacteraceae bacterium]
MILPLILSRFFEPGPGRVAIGGRTVAGLNTEFTKTFRQGDAIEVCGQTCEIDLVEDDFTMSLRQPWRGLVNAFHYNRINADLFVNTGAGLLVFNPHFDDFTVSLVVDDGEDITRRELWGEAREAAIDSVREYLGMAAASDSDDEEDRAAAA